MAIMWIHEHLCLVKCVVSPSTLIGIAIFMRRILIIALMNVLGTSISHLNLLFTIVALKQFVNVAKVLMRTKIVPFVLKGKRILQLLFLPGSVNAIKKGEFLSE